MTKRTNPLAKPITAELLMAAGFDITYHPIQDVTHILADKHIDRIEDCVLFLRIDLANQNRVSICEYKVGDETAHERILSKTVLVTMGHVNRLCNVLGIYLE